MRAISRGAILFGAVFACSNSKSNAVPVPSDDRAVAVAIAVDAAVPMVDAGPPPLVAVTITSVATPDKVVYQDLGRRGVHRPKAGQKLVLITVDLSFSRCVDPPGDDSWKRNVARGQDPGPEPRMVRLANIHGALVVPGHDPIAAHGFGSSAAGLMLSSYTEIAYPCADPDHGRSAITSVFLFAVPSETDLAAANLSVRGTRVPLPPAN